VGDVVGVHDGKSQVPQAFTDRGFSRSDATGDDNSFH
jgi:hypothetical protein